MSEPFLGFPEFGRVKILWRGGRTSATSVEKPRKIRLIRPNYIFVIVGHAFV